MTIDWVCKLQRLLQTLAFCLAVSALHWAFRPEVDYAMALVYSVAIGSFTWAWIDFGRHLFPSSRETGWPKPLAAVLLVVSGIVAGYVLGMLAGDAWFGRSSWSAARSAEHLRGSLLITAVAGIVVTYYFYAQSRGAYLARQMDEARLRLLESQLEPHMLFNTLANLRVLIALDPPRAQAMLDRLIAFLRATLDASRSSSRTLAAEFERLDDYLQLMAVRMGDRLRTQFDLPDDLRALPVPPLLLQPLVENSIRHGLEPKVGGGRLCIAARRQGDALELMVRDTGVGLAAGPSTEGTRFGLQQVRERLHALYGRRATLTLQGADDAEGGTLARITLPWPA